MSDLLPATPVPASVFKPTDTPPAPGVQVAMPDVSDAELREAAESLGMRTFRPSRAQKLKKLGIHHAAQGVVHMGLGQLAYVDDALVTLLNRAVELADNPDHEVAVSAIQAGKAIADTMRENVKFQVELQQQKLIEQPKVPRTTMNFEQPVVLQVHVGKPEEKNAIPVDATKQ